MKTLYYVAGGGDLFAFHLRQKKLALVNGGTGSKSTTATLVWAGEHNFEFVARCGRRSHNGCRRSRLGTGGLYE